MTKHEQSARNPEVDGAPEAQPALKKHARIPPDLEADRVLGAVSIGRGTYVGAGNKFRTWTETEKIKIGRYCSIATEVTICTGGNHRPELPSTWPFDDFMGHDGPSRTYKTSRDTDIGCDVWIGSGAYVGGGVAIGHGAVIGARAVVLSDVPPYAMCVGNPAAIVRYRFSQTTIDSLLQIAWWDWPPELVRARREWFYQSTAKFVAEFAPRAE